MKNRRSGATWTGPLIHDEDFYQRLEIGLKSGNVMYMFVFMKRMDRDSCLLSCEEIGTASDAIKLGLTLHSVAILSWVANRLSCYYCIPLALQHFILNTKLIILTLHSYVRCCLLTILILYNLSSYLYSNCLMFLIFWVVSEKKVVDKYFHKSCIKVWQIIILNA